MKKLLLSLLVLAVPACQPLPASQRVVVCESADVSAVQRLLDEGWTVAHQSASMAGTGGFGIGIGQGRDYRTTLVFTLEAPSAEALAAAQAKKAAEWQAKREAYLKAKAEKEGAK